MVATCSTVDSGGAGGARATPEFGGSEKRTERDRQSITTSTPGFKKAIYGSDMVSSAVVSGFRKENRK